MSVLKFRTFGNAMRKAGINKDKARTKIHVRNVVYKGCFNKMASVKSRRRVERFWTKDL